LLDHSSTTFDALDRPVSRFDSAGFGTHNEYDETGNVTAITNPDGYTIRFEYDGMNRPTRAFDEHGRAVSTDYDIGGRPVRVTDPNGNSTVYDYYGAEENGRLKRLTQADGQWLDYFYDNNGNVIKTRDNIGRENRTDFDALNRPIRSIGPVHNSDGLNNIRQVTVTSYTGLGFVKDIQAGYTANTTGNPGSDVLSTQATYTTDDFGRRITQTDANGNATSNGKRNDFLYDATRRLTAITRPNSEQINFLFDAGGRLRETNLPNGVSARYQYDKGNKLKQLINRIRQGIISQHDYGYDTVGRRKIHIETIAGTTTNYAYDNLDRLTQVLSGTTPVETSTYDQYNNRRTQTRNGGTTNYYQYGKAQQLNKILTGSNTGNLKYKNHSGITRTYTYNALERFEKVQGSNIATETYRYDPQGRRIEKSVAGTTNPTTRYQ